MAVNRHEQRLKFRSCSGTKSNILYVTVKVPISAVFRKLLASSTFCKDSDVSLTESSTSPVTHNDKKVKFYVDFEVIYAG